MYLEFVDNSRGDWGLLTIEDIITYYDTDPVVTDEIGWNLLNEIDHRRDYDNMRDYIDPLIASISDEAERITFQKTFYSTIDGIKNNKGDWPGVLHYKDNGMTFVYTGDIHAMWLRDSSAGLLPYLQFMEMDQDVKHMVRGLLLQQFEHPPRSLCQCLQPRRERLLKRNLRSIRFVIPCGSLISITRLQLTIRSSTTSLN